MLFQARVGLALTLSSVVTSVLSDEQFRAKAQSGPLLAALLRWHLLYHLVISCAAWNLQGLAEKPCLIHVLPPPPPSHSTVRRRASSLLSHTLLDHKAGTPLHLPPPCNFIGTQTTPLTQAPGALFLFVAAPLPPLAPGC